MSALIRTSLLLQFLRIFVPMRTPRRLFNFVRLLIVLNVLFYVSDTIATTFQCVPRKKIWRPHTPGHCLNLIAHVLRTAVANVCSDIFIAGLPIKAVWRLQMPMKRKIQISAIFGIGLSSVCLCPHSSLDDARG